MSDAEWWLRLASGALIGFGLYLVLPPRCVLRGLSRALCRLGCHDWREMNGRCRKCGKVDRY